MNKQAQDLVQRCDSIHQGGGEAIGWIEEVRGSSPRLDRESASLTLKIRRTRNLVRRLGRAASRPLAVGFFGLSQAGKSYLISALAAGENGELETDSGRRAAELHRPRQSPGARPRGHRARHPFHPPGGSTAPRLSHRAVPVLGGGPGQGPGQRLLQRLRPGAGGIQYGTGLRAQAPGGAGGQAPPAITGGVNEDSVVELQDYFEQRFPRTMEQLQGDYWPTAIALAPYLDPQDRGALFSILWGEIPELTQTYMMLRDALADHGLRRDPVLPDLGPGLPGRPGRWTQADSIVNVDILERLGKDRERSSGGRPAPRRRSG